jgi:catalase
VPERVVDAKGSGPPSATRMVSNILCHASQDVSDDVQGRVIGYRTGVDANLGARVAAGLGCGAGQRAA